ncbi:Pirin-like protein [Cupriavidus sp. H19C3]|uniref:pirin family protein n=1 Tax=Cupriavidus sp. H19C3 TaxID=3241603 RepID=UPI003BF7B2B6
MRKPANETKPAGAPRRLGVPVAGVSQQVGDGFTAWHFSEEMFGDAMDPLLMVDHFVMTGPTFAPHLHAGISAVTVLFEDTQGHFINRDTLGHNLALKAGDLYWLAAAAGAAHEERPEEGARVHALQVFVNLPAALRHAPARALHVRAEEAAVIRGPGQRIRVVLGRSGETLGAEGTPEEMTLLDGFLEAGARFAHVLPPGRQAWLYAVAGALTVRGAAETCVLPQGHAMTIAAGPQAEIVLEARQPGGVAASRRVVGANAPAPSSNAVHFVLMAGRPVREAMVRHGSRVASAGAGMQRTLTRYANDGFLRAPT